MTKTKSGFEANMKRLNDISEIMGNDDVPLDDALRLYGEAVNLVESCKKEIDEARLTLKDIFAEEAGETFNA